MQLSGIQGYRDTGLSRGIPFFPVWVNTEKTTKGWVGAEADGKYRNMSLCTHNNQLCLFPNHKQVFKRNSSSSLGCFGGLEYTPGIASSQPSVSTLSLQSSQCPRSQWNLNGKRAKRLIQGGSQEDIQKQEHGNAKSLFATTLSVSSLGPSIKWDRELL